MSSISSLTSIASLELRLNNATAVDIDDSMPVDNDKPPSVTLAADVKADDDGDAESSEAQLPLSPSPPVHVLEESLTSKDREQPALNACVPVSSNNLGGDDPRSEADQRKTHYLSRHKTKPDKPRWNPLDRYFSAANSFPDYGERKRSEAMNQQRLKLINGASNKPINTLNFSRCAVHDSSEPPPPKRAKTDDARRPNNTSTTSPYFKKIPFLEDEFPDATVEGSRDDPHDLRSVSSTGPTVSTGNNVEEYRTTHDKISRKHSRLRKSRNASIQGQRDSALAKSHVFPQTGPGHRYFEPDSPDDLSFGDPPPANVGSDLIKQRGGKRNPSYQLVDSSEPRVKRPRISSRGESISEDELQASLAPPAKPDGPLISKFRNILEDRESKKNIGGKNDKLFMKSPRRNATSKGLDASMIITRAACGGDVYEAISETDPVLLFYDDINQRLEPTHGDTPDVEGLSWLAIDLGNVHHIYTSDESLYALVTRSKTDKGGPKLYLQFESLDHVGRLRQIASRKISLLLNNELEKKANHAFQIAKTYSAANIGSGEKSIPKAHVSRSVDSIAGVDAVSSWQGERTITGQSPQKLKDKLLQSAQDTEAGPATSAEPKTLVQYSGQEIRRSTRASAALPPRQLTPERWTELNPEWQKGWQRTLVFPATGKNRATIDEDDIPRLDEGEYLNDNLINFYLRYLQAGLERNRPELLNRIYFFSTFFFEKLKSTRGKINYEGVKSWTAKVDIFSYDYIVVPVNEHAHWYLAIICNTPNLVKVTEEEEQATAMLQAYEPSEHVDLPSSPMISTVERDISVISLNDRGVMTRKRTEESGGNTSSILQIPSSPNKKRKMVGVTSSKVDPKQPKIITLDSLGSTHSATCRALKDYLVEEAKAKKHLDLAVTPTGMTAKGIPEQNNFCDCGVFVLGYMQEFLRNPDEVARKLLLKDELEWNVQPSKLRSRVRELLFDLQMKQEQRLTEEKMLRKGKKKLTAEVTAQSSLVPAPKDPFSSPTPKLPGAFPLSPEKLQIDAEPILSSSQADEEVVHESLAEPKPIDNRNFAEMSNPERHGDSIRNINFISTLVDESSPSRKSTAEPFVSAKSSPVRNGGGSGGQLVVELKMDKISDRSAYEASVIVDDDSDVQFVKELSSSTSESKKNAVNFEKGRQRSVEVIEADTLKSSSSTQEQIRRGRVPGTRSHYFEVRPSIETEDISHSRDSPKYDGIDQSVDAVG